MSELLYRLKLVWRQRYQLPEYVAQYKDSFPNDCKLILFMKMIYGLVVEGCLFVEFFWYHWKKRTYNEGRKFVYALEREKLLKRINPLEKRWILNNKWETFNYFKPFYKRGVWLIGNHDGNYLADNVLVNEWGGRLVFKPLDANCGRGVRIEAISSKDDLIKILTEYGRQCLAEELIVQKQSIGILHPSSINTLRLNTFLCKNGSVILFAPVLRIGRGGSIVDNAGAGGIIAAIDKKSGIVIAVRDEQCNVYEYHPDTKVRLVGFVVPEYDDAVNLVVKMAKTIPDLRLIGWDLALTDKGWVLVEANANPNFLWQIATRKGIREEFEFIKKEV